jgi:hypothetical protein
VKRFGTFLGMLLLISPAAPGQTKRKTREADSDQLGMSCTQMLKMTSTDWVAKFTTAKAAKGQEAPPAAAPASPDPQLTIRAIAAYGKCYDARTNRLAAVLGREGKGPLMGARGDFGEFEKSLKDFEAATLDNVQPPASEVKKSYAALYEKQFRYAFYLSYTPAPQAAPTTASSASRSSSSAARSATSSSSAGPGESSSVRSDGEKPPSAAEEVGGDTAADDTAEQFTKAKNKFGQLLEALPEDNARAVHAALGNLLGAYEVGQETRLDVYLYAIFLLEPDGAKPFAPAPF